MIKVYFDTNVLLDIALKREPFFENSMKLLELIENNKIVGYVNGITIANLHYIISKSKGKETALQFIKDLLVFFEIADLNKNVVTQALYSGFTDFEDAIQNYSAQNTDIKILITRNIADFKLSTLQIFEPHRFLEWINQS